MKVFAFLSLLAPAFIQAGTTEPSLPSPTPPPSSAGLLNDALRHRTPAFSVWDIGGDFRVRHELKHDGGSFPNHDFISRGVDNDNDYLLFRERVHIGWQPESWLNVYVEGRGAQAVSDDRDPSPDQDTWDLYQAYIKLGDPKLFPLTLQIGRQEMVYADQRVIGNGPWNNAGRSFDAIRMRAHAGKSTWVDLFTSRVVIPRDEYFNESNGEDQFSGIYASSQEILAGIESQTYFLARNVSGGSPDAIAPGIGGPSERNVYTYGLRLRSLPAAFGPWDFTLESVGQLGNVVSGGRDRDLQAFAAFANLGYTIGDLWGKPRFGLGWDYASGDGDPNDAKQETFEPLFGTNHNYYGVMDLFGPRNINSPRVSFSIRPTKKFSISLDYTLFWLADDNDFLYPESGSPRNTNGYGRNPQLDSFAGSELDIVAKYAFTPWADLQLGYGHFFPGDYVKSSVGSVPVNGGATGADWVYVQTTITF